MLADTLRQIAGMRLTDADGEVTTLELLPWILDLLPDATEWGPIFYACHDPAVIAYQSPSLEAFIRDLVAQPPDGTKSPINHVHETVVNTLWRDQSALIAQPTALASPDSALREFAATVDASALIADLRNPKVGDGFAWGLHGPRTEIRRYGTARLWALTRPPKKPGFLSRLFGS